CSSGALLRKVSAGRDGGGEGVDDIGQGLRPADVAGEDDVGHAEDLLGSLLGGEQGDLPGPELALDAGAADPEAVRGDLVGGDAALGDHPGGPGGAHLLDDLDHGVGDAAGDVEGFGGVVGAHQVAACVQHAVAAGEALPHHPGDLREMLGAALVEDGGDVDLHLGEGAAL